MRNSWQHAVQAAMDESDMNRLEPKIQQAEVAIFQRIDAFSSARDGEAEALFEALRKTRELSNQLTLIQSGLFLPLREIEVIFPDCPLARVRHR
jgi:hypothetical protein